MVANSRAGGDPRKTSGRQARTEQARRARIRAKRTKTAVIGSGVAIVLAVVLVAIAATSGGATGVTDPARFDLPALEGNTRVQLAAFHGKPVVVNLFASWCTVCETELPAFVRVAKQVGDKVAFVGVNSVETGNGKAMADRHGLRVAGFTLARDINGANASGYHDALGANGMPATAFYDANGKLVDVELTGLPESVLRQKLQQLFGITA